MKRIALLGCGGFIGSHLLEALLRADYDVLGWDAESHRITSQLGREGFSFYPGDLYQDPQLEEKLSGCDVVISLAAICWPSRYSSEGLEVIRSNFSEPARLVEIAARRKLWLIHFSTSEVYGKTLASQLGPQAENTMDLNLLSEDLSPMLLGPVRNSRWSYACAKQLLERWIFAHHLEKGLRFTVVRPFNFIGSGMDFLPGLENGEGIPRVLACFLSALLKGEPLKLVDGGKARRAFLHVDEAVDAVLRMLAKPEGAANQIFNLGHPGNEITIRGLAEMLREVFAEAAGEASYRNHPMEEVTAREFYGEGYEDSDRRLPDIRKASERLGWEPRISLREALKRIVGVVVASPRVLP